MTTKVESKDSRLDFQKWALVAFLVVLGVVGNQYYLGAPLLYRVLALLVLGVLAAVVAFSTTRGRAFHVLLVEAKLEIRKVVWPTRQETMQTTFVVVAVVLVMALVLWGLDSFLGWLVSTIVG